MLTNVKEFLKKHDILCVVIFFIVCLSGIGLNVKILPNSDELWNFQNIYKMLNGYEIYKDANVIVTPLFFYIVEFIFKIFGNNFLVFRIFNIVVNVILYLLIYLIFKNILKFKQRSILYTLIVLYISNATLMSMANYTSFAVMFYILGIFLNIKENKNYILHGIIIFCIFMCKQNIGIYYILGMFIQLIAIDKLNKKSITQFCKKICVFIFLFIIYCTYLYLQGNLYNFISYCFLGVSEFGTRNLATDAHVIQLIFIPVCIIFIKKLLKKKQIKLRKIDIIECFAFPMLLISYPIFNESHIENAMVGIIIELILILDFILFKDILKEHNIKKIIYILTIFVILISSYQLTLYIYYISEKQYKYDIYFGSIIDEEFENNIQEITEYIEKSNKKTIVFGYRAASYNIVLNTSNGAMDIPFFGNFGKDGEDGMLKQIQELKNTNILIEKDENQMIWQESKKIRKWIQENLNCVGEIENFLIYETE